MRCSCCKTELVIDGTAKYVAITEDFDYEDDIPLRDKYVCPNKGCIAHGNVFWNQDGDLYDDNKSDWWRKQMHEQYSICRGEKKGDCIFVGNMISAIGSLARMIEASREKKWFEFTLFNRFKIDIRFRPTADYDGNILSKKITRHYWVKSNDNMWTGYIPGISMLWFCISSFHRDVRRLRNTSMAIDEIKERLIKEHIKPMFDDKRWWKRMSQWYCGKMINVVI